MRRLLNLIFPLLVAIIATWTFGSVARAAGAYGVQDDASFFSQAAVAKAADLINDIRVGDNRDVLVITYPAIPDNLQDTYKSKGKHSFFSDWVEQLREEHHVSGIVILLTKEPAQLQIDVGNTTAVSSFTLADRDQLTGKMLTLLKEKEDDKALLDGLQFIKDRMKRAGSAAAAPNTSYGSGSSPPYSAPPATTGPKGFSTGGLLCMGVAILIVVAIIIGAVSRGRGNSGGYGGQGGYPPGYSGGYQQGGYPQGGGYGGGGGGGFGRGLLGGLLGGALGAWGYEKFNQPNTPNYTPPSTGGGNYGSSSDQTDTSSSSTGGDFGSSPDSGSSSSGGDFGGGGGDFGSSSDSSGGGGDFGGGGGDFGGGGDSGGSSGGGDF